MEKPLTFSMDMAGGACPPGMDQARVLFKPNKKYTLVEMLDAGLPPEHVAWMLQKRVQLDGTSMPAIQAWATAAMKQQGLRASKCESLESCAKCLQRAMKEWAKERPTSKGARQWTLAVLVGLIRSGEI